MAQERPRMTAADWRFAALFFTGLAGYFAAIWVGGPALWRAFAAHVPGEGRMLALVSGFLLPVSVVLLVLLTLRTHRLWTTTTPPRPAAVAHAVALALLAVAAFLNSLVFFCIVSRGRRTDGFYVWLVRRYPGAPRFGVYGLLAGFVAMFTFVILAAVQSRPPFAPAPNPAEPVASAERRSGSRRRGR